MVTLLLEALQTLGRDDEVALAGRWLEIPGVRCAVFVVEARLGGGFYAWCGAPCDRTVQFHHDPIRAIELGLRRAA